LNLRRPNDPKRVALTHWGIPVALLLLALAVRLPALGRFLTPDEFLWVDRSRYFLVGLLNPAYECKSPANHTGFEQAVGLACTLRTGHPGVTTMWTGSLGILLRYLADGAPGALFDFALGMQTNPLDPRFIVPMRLPTVVLTSLWVAVMYWLAWRLLADWRAATAAGLLLALDPFHAAFSRVIHHDALATTFMTVSLLLALMYWGQQRSRFWLVASGAIAGLAFLSKSPALFLNPFIALIGLWSLAVRRSRGEVLNWRHVMATVGDGFLWFGCAAVAFVALWPAMWVIPLDTLRTIFFIGSKYAGGGHAKGNYFLGAVSRDPGALFYPVTWLLRSSPIVWAGLVAAAITLIRQTVTGRADMPNPKLVEKSVNASPRHRFAASPIFVLLLFVLLFVAFMTLGEKKQDRYILPVYPILSIVAAIGLTQVATLRSRIPHPQAVILAATMLFQGVLVVTSYPYYLTYYNPLLGGIRVAERAVTVGWGEGLDLAAGYLSRKPNADSLRVSAWYQSTFAPFFKGEAISYSKEKGKAMAGDYVVFYINQLQRRFPDDELFRYFETRYTPEKVIPLKGVDYVVIYPGPSIQHYVEDRVDEHKRVYRGIAALLGWDWLAAPDPNRPEVAAGSTLPFRLYWEYLGKVPEERFFFRLIGPDGYTWAEGLSTPVLSENGNPATWRQGQVITEMGELSVPTGTPPGEYQLQIGFYTQAPAVPEGELIFDLPSDETTVVVVTAAQTSELGDLPIALRRSTRLAELRLVGISSLDIPLMADQPWVTDVYWQAVVAAPTVDYQARLSLIDSEGQTRWSWDQCPLVSFYPTSRWGEGEIVRSQMTITPTHRTPGGGFDMVLTLLDAEGRPAAQEGLGAVHVEGRVRSFHVPSVDVPLGVVFGDAIELVGFDLRSRVSGKREVSDLHSGDELAVTLVWRALAPVDVDYTVTVQLLGPDGQVYGQMDVPPLDGDAPTSTWTLGEVLDTTYRFVITEAIPPGEYGLLVALYLPETGERLEVQKGGDAVTLVSVGIVP
jgi:4-amino-4-deoxy-L-arabinose transferase-like glycosyltransferase